MNQKLLSLFITPMTGNGGDRVVLNLTQAFADLGFNVDLVVPEVTDYHRTIMPTLSPLVRTIDMGLPLSKTIYFKKLFKLRQYLTHERPLVLLANGDYVGLANAAKLISHSPTKIIQVVHVHVSQYFGKMSSLRTRAKCFFLKQFYKTSDGIIAVSQALPDLWLKSYERLQNAARSTAETQ